MEADNIKFRCSSLGHIMTDGNSITEKQLASIVELEAKRDAKGLTEIQKNTLSELIEKRDNPELAQGVKTHLIDVYTSYKFNRREEIINKFLDKGNEREEDAITLVSRTTQTFLLKNCERLNNNFIQGEPDLFFGESILEAEYTRDTKVCWSLHTFNRAKFQETDESTLNKMYKWQGVGYMDLTGSKKHSVDYCLVNGTAEYIMSEKFFLMRKMKVTDPTDPAYVKKCKQLEINHIFDLQAFIQEYPGFEFHNEIKNWSYDVPMKDRIHTITFDRNEGEIKKMHDRVLECREYMEKVFFS